jgi:hypothetical protein
MLSFIFRTKLRESKTVTSNRYVFPHGIELLRIGVGGAEAEVQAVPVKDATQVKSVVEKFRDKYGADDVKRYYSKLNVAAVG